LSIDSVQHSGRGRQGGKVPILSNPRSCAFYRLCCCCVGVPATTFPLNLKKEVPDQLLEPLLVLCCFERVRTWCACVLEHGGQRERRARDAGFSTCMRAQACSTDLPREALAGDSNRATSRREAMREQGKTERKHDMTERKQDMTQTRSASAEFWPPDAAGEAVEEAVIVVPHPLLAAAPACHAPSRQAHAPQANRQREPTAREQGPVQARAPHAGPLSRRKWSASGLRGRRRAPRTPALAGQGMKMATRHCRQRPPRVPSTRPLCTSE
jgi:hypothetical protein